MYKFWSFKHYLRISNCERKTGGYFTLFCFCGIFCFGEYLFIYFRLFLFQQMVNNCIYEPFIYVLLQKTNNTASRRRHVSKNYLVPFFHLISKQFYVKCSFLKFSVLQLVKFKKRTKRLKKRTAHLITVKSFCLLYRDQL